MLQRWADLLATPEAKIPLGLVGVLATIVLGPMSLLGIYLLQGSIVSDAPDKYMFLGWSVVGTVGTIAIAAAWVRILVPRRYFQQWPALKWATTFGLSLGLVIAVLLLRNQAMVWFVAPTIPIGVFLIGATIGERRSLQGQSREAMNAAP
ncbi:MAG: hypothetical protein U1F08_13470 [Steroidobacteraceae bacterium]